MRQIQFARWLCGISLCLLSLATLWSADESGDRALKEFVYAGIKTREEALSGFVGTFTFRRRKRSENGTELVQHQKEVVEYASYAGKVKTHMTVHEFLETSGERIIYNTETAFDGRKAYYLDHLRNNGFIASEDNYSKFARNPLMFGWQCMGKPLSEVLIEAEARKDLVNFVKRGDRIIVEIQTEGLEGVEKIVLNIDPARGFIAEVVEAYYPEGHDTYRIEEAKQFGDTLWFPTKGTQEWYNRKGELTTRVEMETQEVSLDPDLPEDYFVIRFPIGTIVGDDIAGITYRAGQPVTGAEIEGLVMGVSSEVSGEREEGPEVETPAALIEKPVPAAVSPTPSKEEGLPEAVEERSFLPWLLGAIGIAILLFIVIFCVKKLRGRRVRS